MLVQRFVDAWMSFPDLVILIVVVAVVGPGMPQIIGILGLLVGIGGSRIIRSAVLSVREQSYVHAAQSIGGRTLRVMLRHILPNVMAPVIVLFTTRVGNVILAESALSFLGFGVPPPAPTWGGMLTGSRRNYMYLAPWMALAPGICLTLVVFSINMFGDALRDLLDPRMRNRLGIEEEPRRNDDTKTLRLSRRRKRAEPRARARRPSRRPSRRRRSTAAHWKSPPSIATLSALSFDSYDWPWKHNHDTGHVLRAAVRGRPAKSDSARRQARLHGRRLDPDRCDQGRARREAGSGRRTRCGWSFTLRKGMMFPEKPGVMEARELVADDVVFSFKRLSSSPKATKSYFDYVKDVTAPDKYTVVFDMKEFNAEWDYRFGYGYYSAIMPKEVVDAGAANWKNVNGTGPFKLTDYVPGQLQHLRRRTRTTGTRRRSTRRSSSCPSSTRSPTASSRTKRRASPRCAPARSTSWSRCAGRTSSS